MKKLIIICIVFAILLVPMTALAQAPAFDDTAVGVSSAMLIDQETGNILYEKNKDERIYPASTTKLMTALLLMENKGLDGSVKVGPEVNQGGGASLTGVEGLKQGETIPIKDLFYGMMVCSGNDAAAALAVYVAGNQPAFVQMMNDRAQQLGMTNTHFLNPHGTYEWEEGNPEKGKDHYTTAADMAKLTLAVMKYPEVMEAAATKTYTIAPTDLFKQERVIEASNYLLYTRPSNADKYGQFLYDGTTGLKTGLNMNITVNGVYHKYNGALVCSATRGDVSLVSLVFGDYSDGAMERWSLSKNLLDYGFNNYQKVDLSQYIQPVSQTEQLSNYAENDPEEGKLEVISANKNPELGVQLVDKETAVGLADGSLKVESVISLTKPMVAPIEEKEEVGTVSYILNGETVYSDALQANRKVYQAGEEKMTKQEYDLSAFDGKTAEFQVWYLWIIIPAAAAAVILIIRYINKARMRSRRRGRDSRKVLPFDDAPRHKSGSSGRTRMDRRR